MVKISRGSQIFLVVNSTSTWKARWAWYPLQSVSCSGVPYPTESHYYADHDNQATGLWTRGKLITEKSCVKAERLAIRYRIWFLLNVCQMITFSILVNTCSQFPLFWSVQQKLTSCFQKFQMNSKGLFLSFQFPVKIDLATTCMKGHFFNTEKMNSNRTSCPLEKNTHSHVIYNSV